MRRWLNNRGVAHALIALLFVVPAITLLSIHPTTDHPYLGKIRIFLDHFEYSTIDDRIQFGRKAEPDPRIILLGIDEPSIRLDALDDATIAASPALSLIRQKGAFPYPREVYADICDQLFAAGAKVVAFDVLFANANAANDPPLAQALDKYQNQVVIGLFFNPDSTSITMPADTLIPSGDPLDDRVGYVNFWRDTDNMIRSTHYRSNLDYLNHHPGAENEPKLYSLAARVVQKSGVNVAIPDDFASRRIRFAGASRFTTYSLYQIFDPHSWADNFQNGALFRDKIVIVGPSGAWSKDILPTPIGDVPGVEVHLNAINALLHNEFLTPASDALNFIAVAAAGLITFALSFWIIPVAWRFVATLAALAGYSVAVMLAFNGPGWLLPVVAPVGVFAGSSGVGFIYDFVLNQIEKFRLRTTFERYNSKNVAKYLLEHTETYNEMLVGTRRPVTALFSDVRGFTTIAEETPDSQHLVAKLNEYLTGMVACVFRFDGSLDSFMGDGIMAVWGNTPYNFGPQEDGVRAVKAALAMLVELRRLNAKWLAEGGSEWRIGIGLNHGQVIVGDIGSQEHKEFATIGDAINLAARLEGLTKEYRLELLIGEDLAELVRDRFHLRSVDIVQVKGKKRAVRTFTVLDEKANVLAPNAAQFLALHEEALTAFRTREFTQARDLFSRALQIEPDDFLAKQYLASCEDYILHPPDAAWTGVRVMKTK